MKISQLNKNKMAVSLNRRSNWTVPPSSSYQTSNNQKDDVKCTLRGIWKSMHRTAAWVNSSNHKHFFSSWVRDQINNLPCQACITHAKDYLRQNPPEGENASIWMWRFHNAVNKRLGKAEMKWNSYQNTYMNKTTPCTSCGH